MRYLNFLCLQLLISITSFSQERYFYAESLDLNPTELNTAVNSQNWIDIDMDSGKYSGIFQGYRFSGIFIINNVSSGFVKGFSYQVELGYLQRDVNLVPSYNLFTNSLALASRFYFYPDILASPEWHFIEISISNSLNKLFFIKKN